QALVRSPRAGDGRVPGRLRDARRALRGADSDPDEEAPARDPGPSLPQGVLAGGYSIRVPGATRPARHEGYRSLPVRGQPRRSDGPAPAAALGEPGRPDTRLCDNEHLPLWARSAMNDCKGRCAEPGCPRPWEIRVAWALRGLIAVTAT